MISVLIALLHLKLKELSRKHNVEKAKKLMKMARDRNVKLVVLPSLFPVGNTFEIYSNEKKLRSMVKNLAEKIPGNNTDILINLAMEGEMHVIAGPLLEQAGPKIFLTSLVLSPQGEIIGKYRKVIISDKDIKLGISGGKEPVYTLLDKRYGIISEDDLYSPEISRILSIFGAQAVIGTMKAMANNQETLKHLAIVRSIENGIPYLINGEVIEDEEGEIKGSSPTFITTPDNMIYKEAEESDTILTVESEVLINNKGKRTNMAMLDSVIGGLCKNYKKQKMENSKKSIDADEED